jgi:membrane fusion protein (multidrug efflux system)
MNRSRIIKSTLKIILTLVVITAVVTPIVMVYKTRRPKEMLRPRRHAVNVSVTPIEPVAEYRDMIRLNGVTEPYRDPVVAAEVAGAVEEIRVTEGQYVQAGTLLVRLNTDLLQAEVDRYQAEVDFRENECIRLRDLRDRDVATNYEVEQAEANFANARALCDLAIARLERSTIEAPVSGVIDELPVDIGEYLQPGTPVARIVDVEQITVVVHVPERDISYLQVGKPALIVAEQRGQAEQFLGEITFISRLADPVTFTTRVEVTIDNSNGQLRTGEIVDVYVERQLLTDIIMIPLESAIPRENDYVVYVVDPVAELTLYLPEEDLDALTPGTPLTVSLPDDELTGTVVSVEPDPHAAGQLEVVLNVDDPNQQFTDGLEVDILVDGHTSQHVAIASLGDESAAAEMDIPVAWRCFRTSRRVVTLNMDQIHGTQIVVTDGLNAGDWLITRGQQYVGPREPVILRDAVDAPPLPASEQREAEDRRLQGEYYQHLPGDPSHAARETPDTPEE